MYGFYDVFLTVLLSVFFLLSAAFQVRKRLPFKKIWSYDKFGLVPNYSFFAPKPLTQDFRIIYSLTDEENQKEFHELELYETSHWFRFFFNPFKYYHKGLIDLCMALITEHKSLEDDSKSFIQISSNYLWVLKILKLHIGINDDSEKTKLTFSIVSTQDLQTNRSFVLLFNSFPHYI